MSFTGNHLNTSTSLQLPTGVFRVLRLVPALSNDLLNKQVPEQQPYLVIQSRYRLMFPMFPRRREHYDHPTSNVPPGSTRETVPNPSAQTGDDNRKEDGRLRVFLVPTKRFPCRRDHIMTLIQENPGSQSNNASD